MSECGGGVCLCNGADMYTVLAVGDVGGGRCWW